MNIKNKKLIITKLLTWIFVIFIPAFISAGFSNAKPRSVFIKVEARISHDSEELWRNYRGSNEKNIFRSMILNIRVMNTGQYNENFRLEWYFFSKGVRRSNYNLFDFGDEQITLKKGEFKNYTKVSETVKANEAKYYSYYHGLYSQYKSGITIKGYIVYVKDEDNNVLQSKASSHDLEIMAKDPETIKQMVGNIQKQSEN